MKVVPMLFNTEMVRALLDGRKTVTRRPVKVDYERGMNGPVVRGKNGEVSVLSFAPIAGLCPFGNVGELIWVRETMDINAYLDMYYIADDCVVENEPENWFYRDLEYVGKIPSIHMPRWASRLTLRVTDVRIERVQEITVEQAIKEGISHHSMNCPKAEFGQLWNELYGNWTENPYVWVIEFDVINKNIDTVLVEVTNG
ncbi:ASCH domain-containing protein [Vibrio parahaemolyticus]|uniref:hypothetical protein n=1 Tax=Vibrio parahaemolyticus TaxID=670 RepID=UPI00226B33F8|nr:hypothetical protein [Vibrio parahaemolyticus]MCX8816998.1 hypothetical protein [Vibrio parahaemolyticus]